MRVPAHFHYQKGSPVSLHVQPQMTYTQDRVLPFYMKSLVGVDSPTGAEVIFFFKEHCITSCPCLNPPMSFLLTQTDKLLMTLSKPVRPPYLSNLLSQHSLPHSLHSGRAGLFLLFFDPSVALYQGHHTCYSLCLNTRPSDLCMA